jgi:hypothetical protein
MNKQTENFMGDLLGVQLRQIILDNGLTIIKDASGFESLVKERCNLSRKELSALMGALREGIVDALCRAQEPGAPKPSLSAVAKDLEENQGLTHDLALWAAEAWALALGVSIPPQKAAISAVATTNLEVKKAKRKKLPLHQRLAAAAVFSVGLCGVVFWSVPDSSTQVEAKTGTANDHSITPIPAATLTPRPELAKNASVAPGNGEPTDEKSASTIVTVKAPDPPKREAMRAVNAEPMPPLTKSVVSREPAEVQIPNGTVVAIHLDAEIDSSTASEGDRVNAMIATPISVEGSVIVPLGSKAVVEVAGVKKAGRWRGSSDIKLQLVQLVVHGREYSLTTQPYELKAGGPGKIFEKGKGISIAAGETIEFSVENSLKIFAR